MENSHTLRTLSPLDYPPRLLEIPQPPDKMYIRGLLPSPLDYVYLSVVGSRKYSEYGKLCVERLISSLAGYPVVIISGLALGIDTLTHKYALGANLKTIAMPGSGLSDKAIYPSINRGLAHEILDKGGCLLSEFEPDYLPEPFAFPKRNRLMAGISEAVLVIEAGEKSGTMITARLATEYNRDVLTIPGSIFSNGSVGPNKLIRQGAVPITDENDLLEALGFEREGVNIEELLKDCSDDEKMVYNILTEPLHIDEITRICPLPQTQINTICMMLVIKEIIKEHNGKFFRNF